jgi:hypothetical protein
MQRVSRALRMAAFSVLAALVLPASAQTQRAAVSWQTSCGDDAYNVGGVALANDTLFVVGGPTLYALNASTGGLTWNATADVTSGLGTSTTPVVVEDIALTIMGQVIAWNASTGAYLWTSNQPTTPYGEAVSVDLKSRTVFVGVQPSTTFPAPLVALHLDTGAVKWQGVIGNLTNVGNGMGPAVVVPDHELVCILTTMSYLVCYDIATGTVAWETCIQPSGQCYQINTEVSGLYYGCGMLVLAQYYGGCGYNVSNGLCYWRWTPSSNYAVTFNCTMFSYANTGSGFSAVNVLTGEALWMTPENWDNNLNFVIAGGNVLVLRLGAMYMFNMTTGVLTSSAVLPAMWRTGYSWTDLQYRKKTAYLTRQNAVYAMSTLPSVGAEIFTDSACQQYSYYQTFLTEQCAPTADGGSVMYQCSGTEVTVSTYTGNSMCAGQHEHVASYLLGQCIPSLASYTKFTSCGTTTQ